MSLLNLKDEVILRWEDMIGRGHCVETRDFELLRVLCRHLSLLGYNYSVRKALRGWVVCPK